MERNIQESGEPYFELTCPRTGGGHVHYVKASKYRANVEKHKQFPYKHKYVCGPCKTTHVIDGNLKTSWVVRYMK